jgi:hypothetical protein
MNNRLTDSQLFSFAALLSVWQTCIHPVWRCLSGWFGIEIYEHHRVPHFVHFKMKDHPGNTVGSFDWINVWKKWSVVIGKIQNGCASSSASQY